MEQKKIPQDILDDANRLYPDPSRSDYHTDTEYDAAIIYHKYNSGKESYIAGRMDQLAKQKLTPFFKESGYPGSQKWVKWCKKRDESKQQLPVSEKIKLLLNNKSNKMENEKLLRQTTDGGYNFYCPFCDTNHYISPTSHFTISNPDSKPTVTPYIICDNCRIEITDGKITNLDTNETRDMIGIFSKQKTHVSESVEEASVTVDNNCPESTKKALVDMINIAASKSDNGAENKGKFIQILQKRNNDAFSNGSQNHEYNRLTDAINTIIGLVPPSCFDSKKWATDEDMVRYASVCYFNRDDSVAFSDLLSEYKSKLKI